MVNTKIKQIVIKNVKEAFMDYFNCNEIELEKHITKVDFIENPEHIDWDYAIVITRAKGTLKEFIDTDIDNILLPYISIIEKEAGIEVYDACCNRDLDEDVFVEGLDITLGFGFEENEDSDDEEDEDNEESESLLDEDKKGFFSGIFG